LFLAAAKVFDHAANPSIQEFKNIVMSSGNKSLKEIERVTIEKLSNKILRQFTSDLVLMLPCALLILLESRRALS
jgi:hypothetical protein